MHFSAELINCYDKFVIFIIKELHSKNEIVIVIIISESCFENFSVNCFDFIIIWDFNIKGVVFMQKLDFFVFNIGYFYEIITIVARIIVIN